MNGIGIRVFSDKEVFFCIMGRNLTSSYTEPYVSSIVVPNALNLPEQLSFIRTTLLDILLQYDIKRAGIRLAELTAKKVGYERIALEAIAQESLSDSNVEKFIACRIGTINTLLNLNDGEFLDLVANKLSIPTITNWGTFSGIERECILYCLASFKL
jgi:hypothetical protein